MAKIIIGHTPKCVIRGELLKRDYTLKRTAEVIGISRSFLYKVLDGKERSARVSTALMDLLNEPTVIAMSRN